MEDGLYLIVGGQVKSDRPVKRLETTREVALERAVVWANATAGIDRKSPAQIVAAAAEFEAFLKGPEPATGS